MTQTVAGISENFGAFFISADKRWRRHLWRNSFEMSEDNAMSSFLIKTKQQTVWHVDGGSHVNVVPVTF